MIKLANLAIQHQQLGDEINTAIDDVIGSSRFIGGSEVTSFESEFSDYCGVSGTVACGNGTDALEIAIAALQLPEKSEIIVPANSFVASAEAIVNSGHIPVFVDIDATNYGMDIDKVAGLLTGTSKALIAVHLFGIPLDMSRLSVLCKEHDLYLIEDCAQAHGASWRNKTVGSWGDIATFSFFPGKNLGAIGDAGAICSSNEVLLQRCRMIANHGRLDKFGHKVSGRNSRMDAIQAAVLRVKLKHLNDWNAVRRNNADYLSEKLKDVKHIELFTAPADGLSVFHQYVIRVDNRNEVQKSLADAGIETGVHYPKPINDYEPFKGFAGDTPVARELAETILSIPCHQYLTLLQLDKIIHLLNRLYEYDSISH